MWKCCKLVSLHKGVQFSTRRLKPFEEAFVCLWDIIDVLPSGVRVCRNYQTKAIREFSPNCFAWRYFIVF